MSEGGTGTRTSDVVNILKINLQLTVKTDGTGNVVK